MAGVIACPACGAGFDRRSTAACAGCPLRGGCTLVCCPSCGTSTVDETTSALAGLVRRVRARRVSPPGSIVAMEVGEAGTVGGYQESVDRDRRARLEAYGLTVGSTVTLLQRRPEVVVRVDHTELALERSLAERILVVRRMAPEPV